MRLRVVITIVLLAALSVSTHLQAQNLNRDATIVAMKKAAEYFYGRVASHGGYVYHYSLDLSQRWGEGATTEDQIWVQPPGTPTVGMAYLQAYDATGDQFYLEAASSAANALLYGQLKSGGWTNSIDFNPQSPHVAEYRNGRGRGKNHSSLDDGQTQSAIQFLVQIDQRLNFSNPEIHQAARDALDALMAAQFPNGAFPQVWTQAVAPQPILAASYPAIDWQTDGKVKNYWDMYTLNDNVTGYVAQTLIEAHRVYEDTRYLAALRKLGDFLLLAQMPEPQPGWSQQYSYEMKPIWARAFEPPAVCGDESQEVIATLMLIAETLEDPKYLEPIPRALAWLERSLLPNNQLSRYYELMTNRPLYMERKGKAYVLTYSDDKLPDHYGWKTASKLEQLKQQFIAAKNHRPHNDQRKQDQLDQQAELIVKALDSEGRWVDHFNGQRLVGQAKMPIGQAYLSSETFSNNLTLLSKFISQPQSP